MWTPPPVPTPKGPPTRTPFVLGAVGGFLAAGFLIPYAIFGGFAGFFGFFFGFGFSRILGLALDVALFVSLLLHLFALWGFWRNYGSQMGIASFAFGIVALVLFLVAAIVSNLASSFGLIVVILAGLILLGVMFILEGAAYIVVRLFVGSQGASIAAGILFVLAGAFICTLYFGFIGDILAVPATIIAGIVLLKAPLPFAAGAPLPSYPYLMAPPPLGPPAFPP